MKINANEFIKIRKGQLVQELLYSILFYSILCTLHSISTLGILPCHTNISDDSQTTCDKFENVLTPTQTQSRKHAANNRYVYFDFINEMKQCECFACVSKLFHTHTHTH